MMNFEGLLFPEARGYPLRFSCATDRDVHDSTFRVGYSKFRDGFLG